MNHLLLSSYGGWKKDTKGYITSYGSGNSLRFLSSYFYSLDCQIPLAHKYYCQWNGVKMVVEFGKWYFSSAGWQHVLITRLCYIEMRVVAFSQFQSNWWMHEPDLA